MEIKDALDELVEDDSKAMGALEAIYFIKDSDKDNRQPVTDEENAKQYMDARGIMEKRREEVASELSEAELKARFGLPGAALRSLYDESMSPGGDNPKKRLETVADDAIGDLIIKYIFQSRSAFQPQNKDERKTELAIKIYGYTVAQSYLSKAENN